MPIDLNKIGQLNILLVAMDGHGGRRYHALWAEPGETLDAFVERAMKPSSVRHPWTISHIEIRTT